MVTVAPTALSNVFICASGGKVFAINSKGSILWQESMFSNYYYYNVIKIKINTLLGLKSMGHSGMCVSTSVFDTDFSSTTLPQNTEMKRIQRDEIIEELIEPEERILELISS